MRYIGLIIFDLDGTLVDSRAAIAKAINVALRAVGLKEKGVAEVAAYIGKGVDDLIRRTLGKEQEHLFERTKTIFENYRKNSADSSHLYAGVAEILEYFKQKSKAVLTNRKNEFARPTLARLGIDGYFAEVVGADNLGCMKPAACPLENIVRRLKVDKKRAIIVGDMDIDILAGKAAGILTCGVTYGIGKKADIIKTEPDFIIDNILDLKKIIN